MTACHQTRRVQDHLDGALSPSEAAAFRTHLAGCPDCAAELARYRRVFAALAALPQWNPSPALTERVLVAVLPSRVRARRLRALGWGYAGTLAVMLGGVAAWSTHPAAGHALELLSGEASRRLLQTGVFVLNSVTHVAVRFAQGWGLVSAASERLSPLQRAMVAIANQPAVGVTVSAALLVCAGLLWWMRPRPRSVAREVRHVGVLGF